VRLVLRRLPAFVAIDTRGADLYESAPRQWRARAEG
jgi:ribosomal protein L39E